MSYRVIRRFKDLQDNSFTYEAGDIFPRLNKEVSEERLAELSSTNNRRGEMLIERVEEMSADDFPMNPPEDTVETVSEAKRKKRNRSKKKEAEDAVNS